MNRDDRDALMDQLLREILGNDRPRDLTARVLAQVRIYDRFRRRWWASGVIAAAAAVVLAASLYLLWPQKYPGPEVRNVAIMNANQAQPGAMLATDDVTSGSVKLGNYVNILMQPQTALTLGGERYQEKVFLDQGALEVSVEKDKGKFDVAVGPATVHVTGTKFSVDVVNEEVANAQQKKLVVHVEEGMVEVRDIPGEETQYVSAGQQKEFVILYTPKVISQVNPQLTAGLLAAAQEGAKTGNRGGVVGRPLVQTMMARGGLPQSIVTQGRAARLVQMILNPGNSVQYGRLRLNHALYYLETQRAGNIFMFPQSAVPDAEVPTLVGKSVRVEWTDGKVSGITP
jgi:hypothetical protein